MDLEEKYFYYIRDKKMIAKIAKKGPYYIWIVSWKEMSHAKSNTYLLDHLVQLESLYPPPLTKEQHKKKKK